MTLMVKALDYFETSAVYHSTRLNIPEGSNLLQHR